MISERPAETMLAAVLYGSEDLRMERVPIPRIGAGELLLRVGAALTCGTDLKVYRRGYHAMMLKPPVVFGHEAAGVVAEVGAGVTTFRVGDRVLPLNSAPCDACYFCQHGQQNLCQDLLFNNGAYAQYMRIPARIVEKNTLLIPKNVPLQHAALTEPLACVVLGLEACAARAGDTMVVIGAGPIGLMFVHAAKLSGVRVIAVVKREDQIAAAHQFGATDVVRITTGQDTVAAVRELTGDRRGADVVIEAVARPATWEWAVGMVRKGGVVRPRHQPSALRRHHTESHLPPHPRHRAHGLRSDHQRTVQLHRLHHAHGRPGGGPCRLSAHDDAQQRQPSRH
jgi:L-iditol 2-dehydrogenase